MRQQGLVDVDVNIIYNASGQRMSTTKLPGKPGNDYGFNLTLKDRIRLAVNLWNKLNYYPNQNSG